MSGVISPLIWVIRIVITLLITLLKSRGSKGQINHWSQLLGLRHRIDAEQIRCLNAKTCDPVIYLPFTSPTWRSMGSFRQGCKWGNNYILITHIRDL